MLQDHNDNENEVREIVTCWWFVICCGSSHMPETCTSLRGEAPWDLKIKHLFMNFFYYGLPLPAARPRGLCSNLLHPTEYMGGQNLNIKTDSKNISMRSHTEPSDFFYRDESKWCMFKVESPFFENFFKLSTTVGKILHMDSLFSIWIAYFFTCLPNFKPIAPVELCQTWRRFRKKWFQDKRVWSFRSSLCG